ncbi:hypothetical protein HMPREF0758_0873 [Serratia odorifera DSM 4582]|uniref:Uncharacterized protein n=1 Tax=Serratia odorifera DSM 4582 TaxID=667129 RepID=D4DY90_SEROD|nr:hypothetical protein HMPREF0758_0873 [Serratia odorifera DSM 4582]
MVRLHAALLTFRQFVLAHCTSLGGILGIIHAATRQQTRGARANGPSQRRCGE